MLHPALLAELLDDEVEVAAARLGTRVEGLTHDGRYVRCRVAGGDGSALWLRLDAVGYDAEPCAVDFCDDEDVSVPLERWPVQIPRGIHPVHGRPFACIRGAAEYFTHPSHHTERWDAYRTTLRIPELLDHFLVRSGRP